MFAKMWVLGSSLLIAFFILGITSALSGESESMEALINITSIIISIVLGVNGNKWRKKHLISRDFDLMDTVTAANKDGLLLFS